MLKKFISLIDEFEPFNGVVPSNPTSVRAKVVAAVLGGRELKLSKYIS